MHYVTSDIHNDNVKFEKLLERLALSDNDCLYILGDLFDRSDDNPNPVGVYFNILKSGNKCRMIRGNHDDWLAGYISVCGHQNKGGGSIWKNRIGNVYICDCGSGDKNGRLGCLCLETKEEIYV